MEAAKFVSDIMHLMIDLSVAESDQKESSLAAFVGKNTGGNQRLHTNA